MLVAALVVAVIGVVVLVAWSWLIGVVFLAVACALLIASLVAGRTGV
jgi:hypothetical protein